MFKINQLIHWFKRSEPPKEVFAAIRCPVLLLGGTSDTQVSGLDALQQWYDLLVSGESPLHLMTT
jgi:alpha-beta hydrolase superfamily lysophospholipase